MLKDLRNQTIDVRELPRSLRSFISKYPRVWEAHEKLGVECARGGPLTEREIQLIKLAIAGSMSLETSFKTHVRKAMHAGAKRPEIGHTIIQMLPMLGLARTMMAMKWYNEASSRKRRR